MMLVLACQVLIALVTVCTGLLGTGSEFSLLKPAAPRGWRRLCLLLWVLEALWAPCPARWCGAKGMHVPAACMHACPSCIHVTYAVCMRRRKGGTKGCAQFCVCVQQTAPATCVYVCRSVCG